MFNLSNANKKNDSALSSTILTTENGNNHAPSSANSTDSDENQKTIITAGSTLHGEVNCEFDIDIEGTIHGDITSKQTVRVIKNGCVTGTIHSKKTIINGQLKGSCHCQSIKIQSHGRVEGDIFAHEFTIDRGGIFIGNSEHIAQQNLSPHAEKKPPENKPAVFPEGDNIITPSFTENEGKNKCNNQKTPRTTRHK